MSRTEDAMKFFWPVRVYYEDTDSGGVVYYANYLKFMERARTEYLRQYGFEQDVLKSEQKILFAVRSLDVDYHKPAVFNDSLQVSAEIIDARRASFLFSQQIIREQDQTVLCSGQVQIACIDSDSFKPRAIPDDIKESIRVG